MKIFILTVIVCFTAGANAGDGWRADLYLSHTVESFDHYAPALKTIDLQRIDYPLLHAAVFYETNRVRRRHGLQEFRHSEALEKAAKAHSDDMVRLDFFDHASPVKGRRSMADRLAAVGIANCAMAENIAETFGIVYEAGRQVYSPTQNGGYFSYSYRGQPIPPHTYQSLAKAVVEQWLGSQGHRENILNAKLLFLGVGAAHFVDTKFENMDRFRITQCFTGKDAQKRGTKR